MQVLQKYHYCCMQQITHVIKTPRLARHFVFNKAYKPLASYNSHCHPFCLAMECFDPPPPFFEAKAGLE